MDELDYKRHPKIAIKRSLMGIDYKAGMTAISCGIVGMVIAALGVFTGSSMTALLLGGLVTIGGYIFARKFIHAKPSNYFSDWVDSKIHRNYTPKK